ncbi:extracellular superoxide dismutase isoform X1 [Pseudorasbora parva]|uniref:extracellular superoxide dismutase isoform X1 n=1 Tax=Pseudorasbora parva TaxID=51549 RepID=UPI00351E9D84
MDFLGEAFPVTPVYPVFSESPASPVCPEGQEFPPSLPLLPPQLVHTSVCPSLLPFCPSAPSTCCVGTQRVFWPPALYSTELFPHLRLQPRCALLCLGSSTLRRPLGSSLPRLHRKASAIRFFRAPSSLRLRLGQSSTCIRLRLRLAPPSLQLRLCPRSLQISRCPLVHRFHLGCSSPWSPGPSASWGVPRLHQRLLCWSSPGHHPPPSHLLHGSSHHRLRPGASSWLVSGTPFGSWLLPFHASPWTLFTISDCLICCAPRPPTEPLPTLPRCYGYGARTRLSGRGRYVTCMPVLSVLVSLCFSPVQLISHVSHPCLVFHQHLVILICPVYLNPHFALSVCRFSFVCSCVSCIPEFSD